MYVPVLEDYKMMAALCMLVCMRLIRCLHAAGPCTETGRILEHFIVDGNEREYGQKIDHSKYLNNDYDGSKLFK